MRLNHTIKRVLQLGLCVHIAACSAQQVAPAQAPQKPCGASEHRQFDFWLGEWDVHTQDGTLVGHNRIESRHGGCVLHENYRTLGAYTGESLNVFDASRQVWHQTWTDASGGLLLLEGGMRGNTMVMEGQTRNASGEVVNNRISWTPNTDGSVRQHWQVRSDDGEWSDAFDGIYRRVEQ